MWIHNDISKVFGKGLKAKLKLYIDKTNYKKYDKIIFVSNDNKKAFNNLYKINGIEKKEEVIYNYINKERILEKSNVELGQEYIESSIPSIITVTRLTKQKAIDRLINVHKKLISEKIYHNIYVIGDGPEKENLEKQIKELGVQSSFKLMGKRENPYPYVKRADYFALLSNFEGYGMVVDEANKKSQESQVNIDLWLENINDCLKNVNEMFNLDIKAKKRYEENYIEEVVIDNG